MPLPSFPIAGTLFDLLGNVSAGEIVGNGFGGATPATVTFTSNVATNQFVKWAGVLYRVDEVVATVGSDGSITRSGNPVLLLANDPGLSVEGLQWQVHVSGMKRFWFDAPTDGVTLDLASVVPAVGVAAVGLASLPVSGLSNATAFMKSVLIGGVDAATVRSELGISGGNDWESYANLAAFPVTGNTLLEYVAQDTGKLYRWNGSAYIQVADKVAVGLGNVDNTSDAAKPVSTAQQAALDLKASVLSTITLTRDAAGQFASATVDGTVETYTRDSTGRIVTITRGAVTRTVTRDSAGRIQGVA